MLEGELRLGTQSLSVRGNFKFEEQQFAFVLRLQADEKFEKDYVSFRRRFLCYPN